MTLLSLYFLSIEHRYGLPNHSTRGPNEDWLEYRDHPNYGLTAQLLGPRGYEKFVEHWMNKYEDRSNLLMVSYEDLIDNDMGPIVTTRIAHFLGQNEGVEPIADESIPCVWETIVNYKNHPPPTEEELTHGTNVSAKRKATTRKNGRKLMGIETAKDGTTFVDPSSLRTGPKIRPVSRELSLLLLVHLNDINFTHRFPYSTRKRIWQTWWICTNDWRQSTVMMRTLLG